MCRWLPRTAFPRVFQAARVSLGILCPVLVFATRRLTDACLPLPIAAFKCNPDPKVADVLAEAGIGFDCASKTEIQEVLKRDVAPNRIVYAHPCKSVSHLRFAKDAGVLRTVFDNEDEVRCAVVFKTSLRRCVLIACPRRCPCSSTR